VPTVENWTYLSFTYDDPAPQIDGVLEGGLFMNLVMRILNSKKAAYALIPMVVNLVVSLGGGDPTAMVMIAMNTFFGALLLIQGVLDFRYGSASDGTKK